MSRRKKGRISGPFVPVLKDTMKTDAWKALSHGARSLYVALKCRYNSKTQNAVWLSTRNAADELGSHSHRDNIRRWFHELEYYGFIRMVSPAHHGVNGHGKAPHWRLTEEWYLGEVPTRDYERWDGTAFHEQKSPSHYQGKNRSRGPDGWSTLDRTGGPVQIKSDLEIAQSGPDGGSISQDISGSDGRSITSLPLPNASDWLFNDLTIPAFLRRAKVVA